MQERRVDDDSERDGKHDEQSREEQTRGLQVLRVLSSISASSAVFPGCRIHSDPLVVR